MKYRQLGDSDLTVSEIALGSWLTYGGGVERQQAEACVHKAFDVGINFIDTANVYGRGAAESLLGEVLQGIDRSSYVLATKVFFPMSQSDQGLSAAQIYKQLDASLQRLGTDYVDLYQCHRYDSNTPLDETMAALTDVVQQGKVRYIGFSEWNPAQIQAALELPNVEKFVSSQPQYSMLWRQPEEKVFPLCADNGIGQIVWSPLAQGVLTGKYKPGAAPPADSRAANDKMNGFMQDLRSDRVLSAVQNLQPLADQLNISMAQLALAWILRDPRVSAAIVGASRPEQVVDNAAASGISLDEPMLREIDMVLGPALNQVAAR
ncbi:aldo/keto reductase family protein [Nodosilinea sp. LEGE 06152]|uniref:aldo/keto reductase family protein n=1 Tax=Nodosilinea sp. LEGE 06152 TaxID=2777966 RepID=UPI001881E337|nr:aldo/keto reductase family protein [Nodosilinea sp. LEGE 06152]MBE9155845.1 aldo/keto reductase family protein [Nodosilinea sp. LEGE 06152]